MRDRLIARTFLLCLSWRTHALARPLIAVGVGNVPDDGYSIVYEVCADGCQDGFLNVLRISRIKIKSSPVKVADIFSSRTACECGDQNGGHVNET